jgi:hypothetical protein
MGPAEVDSSIREWEQREGAGPNSHASNKFTRTFKRISEWRTRWQSLEESCGECKLLLSQVVHQSRGAAGWNPAPPQLVPGTLSTSLERIPPTQLPIPVTRSSNLTFLALISKSVSRLPRHQQQKDHTRILSTVQLYIHRPRWTCESIKKKLRKLRKAQTKPNQNKTN